MRNCWQVRFICQILAIDRLLLCLDCPSGNIVKLNLVIMHRYKTLYRFCKYRADITSVFEIKSFLSTEHKPSTKTNSIGESQM